MKAARSVLLALAVGSTAAVVLAQAAYTFTVNGRKTALETVVKNGKVFVDAAAVFKALGAKATYDAKTRAYTITTATTPAASQAVQGTAQLAGGAGALGKTYSLGKGEDAMNFTLRSAEYSVSRVTLGNNIYTPKANEKLLVLHYTVQNPQKREMDLGYSTFKITAVDAKDVNHVFNNYIGREGTTDRLDIRLKPAQKVDAYLAMAIPAAGPIPKLIVERGDGSPVLRYDLRTSAKGPGAPFADPSDPSGASLLAEVPAQIGRYYPLGIFDAKLESVAFSTDPMEQRPPSQGKRYLVATFSIKNATGAGASDASYGYSQFKIEMRDADGERHTFNEYLLKPSRDEHADGKLRPGDETRFRVYFELPTDAGAKSISIAEDDSRSYLFDLSSLK